MSEGPIPVNNADLKELLERQKREADSDQRARILHGMELRLAELIGTNGDGGTFGAVEDDVKDLDVRLKKVEEFMNRMKWTLGLFAAGGGAVATLAQIAIKHWLP